MLLWQFILSEMQKKKIESEAIAAQRWIHDRLMSRLQQQSVAEHGWKKNSFYGRAFSWDDAWKEWQFNFDALLRLARWRENATKTKARGVVPQFPSSAEARMDEVLLQARVQSGPMSDGLKIVLCCRDGSGASFYDGKGYFDDLAVFWQAVFLSFLSPSSISSASVCESCGRLLPPSKKLGKPSRQRTCRSCKTKAWRRANPEAARELYREQKRRERSEL